MPGAGAGAVSWLCTWWRVETWCRCWLLGAWCRWWRHRCWVLAVRVVDRVPGAGAGCRTLHILFLADSCVKGCTVCAHTFARFMFYAQRQALNRPLLQDVSACYTHNSRAGYRLALGEWSVRALPFARVCINLYAQDHTALSFYRSLLQACYKFNSGAGYCLALGQ